MDNLVQSLRSVEIGLPDIEKALSFYTNIWNLSLVAEQNGAYYLRGTGKDPYLLALFPSDVPVVKSVTFRVAHTHALDVLAEQVILHGGEIIAEPLPCSEPGAGTALIVRDPQGRIIRFIANDTLCTDRPVSKDAPIRLAHAVMNSVDVGAAQAFCEQAFGFVMSDRTRAMAYPNRA
jgi:predicted enzyme related to lactoylglutathione lyase